MSAPHTKIEEYFKSVNSRYTDQKRKIVDEIFKIKTHFEVDTFIAQYPEFSRATVYRTIKTLFDGGYIQKITTKDGKVFYERAIGKKQHDHLICNSCGKIFEIKETVIEDYLAEYCKSISFTPEYRSLHLYGTCSNCSKNGK